LVRRSRSAVSRCLDSAVFPVPDLGDRRLNRSSESSLRVRLPLEFCPANPSQRAAACGLLSWTLVPFSTSRFGSPLTTGFPGPATFRLQGLTTLLTAYSFRARADLVSCRQRSWDSALRSFPLSKGLRHVTASDAPTCRFSCRYRRCRNTDPSRQAATPGLRPFRESLADWRVFSTPTRWILPWAFALPGLSCDSLDQDPSRSPLMRFLAVPPERPVQRRVRVSIGSRFVRPAPAGKPPGLGRTTLLGFSHRSGPEH
jgi:hypothetical protein